MAAMWGFLDEQPGQQPRSLFLYHLSPWAKSLSVTVEINDFKIS